MTFSFARSPVCFTHVTRRGDLLVGAVLAASALLVGCDAYDSTTCKITNAITSCRINIVQGNFVSREQTTQLKEGMARDRVRFVLDTPLLTDVFHANRWDYIFSFKRGNMSVVRECRLTVWFDGDHLAKWVGTDEPPSESELISEIDDIKCPKKDTAQAAAAAGAALAARVPSIPSAEVIDRVQSAAGSKDSVDVTLPERRTGGGGIDTSVPPPATTSPRAPRLRHTIFERAADGFRRLCVLYIAFLLQLFASTDMRVAIAGAPGCMDQMLIDTVLRTPGVTLGIALDRPASDAMGQDVGVKLGKITGVIVIDDVRAGLSQTDVLIDFTRLDVMLNHLNVTRGLDTAVAIGTTGFTTEQKASFKTYGESIGVVWAPNMSVGVDVAFKLIEAAAKTLAQGYNVEIIETHHKHKIDAPSGTALKMGKIVVEVQGTKLADRAVYARGGETGPRQLGTTGFATVRGDDIVGDHTVLFAGDGKRIEITRRSNTRQSYAEGAMRAAVYVAGKKGLYDMNDVLSL